MSAGTAPIVKRNIEDTVNRIMRGTEGKIGSSHHFKISVNTTFYKKKYIT